MGQDITAPGALTSGRLLPTPDAYSGNRGGAQHPEKRREGGHSVTIQDVAEHLLPTPTSSLANGGQTSRSGDRQDEALLGGIAVSASAGLLPTPTASEGEKGGPNQAYTSGGATLSGTVPHLPTPRASRGASSTEVAYALGGERTDETRPQGVVEPGVDWGPYEAAIRRWEPIIGRPAPSPVKHDGRDGKARLNAELPEWMMGYPQGWVTDILPRNPALKACGNGVAPQQALAALHILHQRAFGGEA